MPKGFADLPACAGYHTGFTGKAWDLGAWTQNSAGPEYNQATMAMPPAMGISTTDHAHILDVFLKAKPAFDPFYYWFGGHEPHRFHGPGSEIRKSKNPSKIRLRGNLLDTPEVRSDIVAHFLGIEWFDKQLWQMLAMLHKT